MCRKIVLLIIVIIMSSYGLAFTSEALKSTFEKANQYYEKGDFAQAVKTYLSIIDAGYENKDVYYNLGNSYFKMGKLGYAILYYEKAKNLAPRDKDIQHNLLFAQNQIVDRIELPAEDILTSFYNTIVNYITINEITIILLLIFYLEMALVIINLFKKKVMLKRLSLIFGIILIMAVSIFVMKFDAHRQKGNIVLVEKLDIFTEPGRASQIAFTVHEGTKLYIMEQRDDWYRVNFENRLYGWVKLPSEQKTNIFGEI